MCTDGSKAAPHWHPLEENIVVVKGTFALATGDTYDAAALHDLTAGSYVFMPKRVHHFALCKGETFLVEYGIGPLTINLLGAQSGAVKKAATK
jgi:quercetin dioxygenase-like cupin family protein